MHYKKNAKSHYLGQQLTAMTLFHNGKLTVGMDLLEFQRVCFIEAFLIYIYITLSSSSLCQNHSMRY